MIVNGKNYIAPVSDNLDIKQIIRKLTRQGAGLEVDSDGLPVGTWTPERLTAAISEVSRHTFNVDLRTVQRWLSEKEGGPKKDSIRWLAQIFGCGKQELVREWQIELFSAHDRLLEKKRALRSKQQASEAETVEATIAREAVSVEAVAGETVTLEALQRADVPVPAIRGSWVERFSESLFVGRHVLGTTAIIWAGLCTVAFVSYIVGCQSLTYVSSESGEKEIGFLWAPSWTIMPGIIMPGIVLMIRSMAAQVLDVEAVLRDGPGKAGLLSGYGLLLWIALFIGFVLVFALQWSGIHLASLMSGSAKGYMIDWSVAALVRPDEVSVAGSLVLSGLGYLFFGMLMWIYFAGLVMVAATATRFQALIGPEGSADQPSRAAALRKQETVLALMFKSLVLCLMMVITIKLQSTYLISSGSSMSSWLVNDAVAYLRGDGPSFFFLHQRSLPQMTTLIIMSVTLVFFGIAWKRATSSRSDRPALETWPWQVGRIALIAALCMNVVSIGAFGGFSIFLAATLACAIFCLARRNT